MFDRRRDLALPTSFLIDAKGEIVKIYQGPIDVAHLEHDFRHIPRSATDRIARALPFPGVAEVKEFARNHLSYGSIFFQRGYLDQAAASFKLAVRDDPESAEALYGVGSVYLDQHKAAEARDCFERALKLHAAYPDTLANAWNNLGLLAGSDGQTAEAVTNFQEALRLSPDHRVALNNLATAYRRQKRWDEAHTTFERSLHLNPDDAEANYGIAMVYAQNDDNARALEHLQRALKARPVYPEALNNLGILYLRTDRRDEAVATFEQSIRVAPTFDQPYLNLANVYAIEETPAKARAVLQALLKLNPDHPAALNMMKQLQ
jgi:tetratricopeptide (TPR) repeat protein